jgi:hypothetical protein
LQIDGAASPDVIEPVTVDAWSYLDPVRGGANTGDFGRFKNRDRGRSAA